MTPSLLFTSKDGFTEFSEPAELASDGEEGESEWLARVGYGNMIWQIGDNDNTATAHELDEERRNKGTPRFHVAFWDFLSPTRIYVLDFASLFTLRIQLAQLIHAEAIANYQSTFEILIDRSYRLAHGHPSHIACHDCDPLAAKTQEEYRRRRAREKGPSHATK